MKYILIKSWLILTFLFVGGGLPVFLHAQTHDINFKNISLDQGLSHKNVLCLLQDSKGYIWFGTKQGLNVYDGHSIKVYTNDPKNKESLSSNHIQSLF